MLTVDTLHMRAPLTRVFGAAADVESWPGILAHYRWVRLLKRPEPGGQAPGIVEMAAWRPFGVLLYPTWWVSEMWVDRERKEIRYRHINGITTGMNVVWRLDPVGEETGVSIVHEWNGPDWPLLRRPAADWVIGPVFIHGIASRTLAGIAKFVEEER